MSRKKHEDHSNHEAWAIPYGDMVTLLLAFFVVMYSISSVNEGKYRVLSDALSHAFGGPPKSMVPVKVGHEKAGGTTSEQRLNIFQATPSQQSLAGDIHDLHNAVVMPGKIKVPSAQQQVNPSGSTGYNEQKAALQSMSDAVQKAMAPLIDRKMIIIRKTDVRLEIEIRTDILFASGAAKVDDRALPILTKLAAILKPFPNALRIEGHTDNVPIHTISFASNWELSAGRAASVVHLFMERGVDPKRMSVEGFGEYRPASDNASADGRNRNRRVVLVVLAEPGQIPPIAAEDEAPAPAVSSAADVTPTVDTSGKAPTPAVASTADVTPAVDASGKAPTPAVASAADVTPTVDSPGKAPTPAAPERLADGAAQISVPAAAEVR